MYLTCVGFAETDDADPLRRLGKTKDMQSNLEHAYSDIACFAVVLPFVDGIQSALEIKLSSRFERETAIANVPLILRWILGDTHTAQCTYKKIVAPALPQRRLEPRL